MPHVSTSTPENKFTTFPGIEIVVAADGFHDYLEARAAQLSSLSALLCLEGFDGLNPRTKANAIWLANSLSEEMSSLVQLSLNGGVAKPVAASARAATGICSITAQVVRDQVGEES